jgi:hypothetical protein
VDTPQNWSVVLSLHSSKKLEGLAEEPDLSSPMVSSDGKEQIITFTFKAQCIEDCRSSQPSPTFQQPIISPCIYAECNGENNNVCSCGDEVTDTNNKWCDASKSKIAKTKENCEGGSSNIIIIASLVIDDITHNMCTELDDTNPLYKKGGLKCEDLAAENYCKALGYVGYKSDSKICDGGTHSSGNWASSPDDPKTEYCGPSGSSEWITSLECIV